MNYWYRRRHLKYYQTVRRWLEGMGPMESLIDVGGWDTPVVTWGQFMRRIAVDPRAPLEAPGIETVCCRWEEFVGNADVITCLQVIEHIDDVVPFCRKLRESAGTLIVSIPYKWRQGSCASHKHDPVDEAKLNDWLGSDFKEEIIERDPDRMHRLCRRY
ncbi:MAG: hypothetical protein KDA90_20910 [Planctomycetaceae bacterium]|nr:hypothetical protein [Planctomycetaceae bacterium]